MYMYLIVLLFKFSVVRSFKTIVYFDQKKQGKGKRRRTKWKMDKEE